jgi:two-component system sensor histidine kinase FlrB
MTVSSSQTAKQLEDAFQAFNQLSMQLSSSYSGLQNQVAELTRELNRARDEKIRELVEKERLADQLDKLLQALPAGVLVLDQKDRVRDANRQARHMLGNDLVGRDWNEISVSAFSSGGDELRLKNGRWISLSMSVLDRESGRILLLSDISETRRLQNLLDQHQRLTALGEMSARLAHQIRTPLSTLLLYLSQVENEDLAPGRRKDLASRMRECLHHMEQTTLNMLAYVRRTDDRNEPFRVQDVIQDLLHTMEKDMESRQAILDVSCCEEPIFIRGNQDSFLGAMINLLNNALEACDSRPELQLEIFRAESGMTAIELTDNGRGMSDETMARVFEPFFTTRSSGTGLGLAVVKAVIQGLGGTILLHSEPGRGTRICIRIPAHEIQSALPATMLPRELSALPPVQGPVAGEVPGKMEKNI